MPSQGSPCIAPHPFSATKNLSLLHHRDSRAVPSAGLGTFLSGTSLLPTGQQEEAALGHPEVSACMCTVWSEILNVQAKLGSASLGHFL